MIGCSVYPVGTVIPIMFTTYGKTNGESITLTGLAVTDIEIYKGTSMTQRSSDNGYALIDTDGIDIDSVTGLHGFSVDTGDNTDAGFYAAGSIYHVVVSTVTIDSQTVTFIADRFRLVAAENTAGVPVADTVRVSGTAQTAGDIIGDTNDIQSRLPAALVSGRIDASVGAMAANVMTAAAAAADLTTELQSGLATAAALSTLDGKVDVIDDYVDTEVAAIKAKTDLIPGTIDGKTFTQLVTLMAAALLGKASGLDTTTAVYRAVDDSKDRITATVDADGNRTAVTLDAS